MVNNRAVAIAQSVEEAQDVLAHLYRLRREAESGPDIDRLGMLIASARAAIGALKRAKGDAGNEPRNAAIANIATLLQHTMTRYLPPDVDPACFFAGAVAVVAAQAPRLGRTKVADDAIAHAWAQARASAPRAGRERHKTIALGLLQASGTPLGRTALHEALARLKT